MPPEQQLEDIKQALSMLIQVIQTENQNLDDETQDLLADVIFKAADRITQLQGQIQETPVDIPDLETAPYPSSNINSFRYDPRSKTLFVKFMGKDTADSGPIYSYDNVPPFLVDVFARGAVGPKTTGKNKYHAWFKGVTPSHGAAMNALIKMGGFAYQRLS